MDKNKYTIFPLLGLLFLSVRYIPEPWDYLFSGLLFGIMITAAYFGIIDRRSESKKLEKELFEKRIELEKQIARHEKSKNK